MQALSAIFGALQLHLLPPQRVNYRAAPRPLLIDSAGDLLAGALQTIHDLRTKVANPMIINAIEDLAEELCLASAMRLACSR